MPTSRVRAAVLALLLPMISVAAAPAQSPAASYHVLRRVTIGGEGGWDYLLADTLGRRLYLSHSTHVQVLELDSLTVLGDIPGTSGVHGIALAPALNRGFTSNGRDSTVTIFDLRTLAVLGTIHVPGANPDAILFDPASGRLFTMNGGSHSATAIDPATGTVLGTLELGGKPEFAVSDGAGGIYVNLEDKSLLARFDGRTLSLPQTWSLAPCESPSGLAIDRQHHRLFAGCDNRLMVVFDPDKGRVVATPAIGAGVDANAFDTTRQLAFSSNGDGTLTIVSERSPERFEVVASVPTQRGARTMTLDERTGRIFTVTAEYGPPPAPTAERPRPRPSIVPGTFTLLVIGS